MKAQTRTVRVGQAKLTYNAPNVPHALWISGERYGQIDPVTKLKLPLRLRLALALIHLRGHCTPYEKHKANWHLN